VEAFVCFGFLPRTCAARLLYFGFLARGDRYGL
jgi:hypothetical protein